MGLILISQVVLTTLGFVFKEDIVDKVAEQMES